MKRHFLTLLTFVLAFYSSISGVQAAEIKVSQTPLQGTLQTKFSQWGEGFTPNSTATLNFYTSPQKQFIKKQAVYIGSSGTFRRPFIPTDIDTRLGEYIWSAVDDTTKKTSNDVTYKINDKPVPTIGIGPLHGPQGTTFDLFGDGFTAGGKITASLQYPNETIKPLNLTAKSDGGIESTFKIENDDPTGNYQLWATDEKTNTKSNTISIAITKSGETLTPASPISPTQLEEITSAQYTFKWKHQYDDEYSVRIEDVKQKTVLPINKTKDKSMTIDLSSLPNDTYTWYITVYRYGKTEDSVGSYFNYKGHSSQGDTQNKDGWVSVSLLSRGGYECDYFNHDCDPRFDEDLEIMVQLQETKGIAKTFEKVVLSARDANDKELFNFAEYNNVTVPALGTWYEMAKNKINSGRPPGTFKVLVKAKLLGGTEFLTFDTTGKGVNPFVFTVVPTAEQVVVDTDHLNGIGITPTKMTGSGFTPNGNVAIEITKPDGKLFSSEPYKADDKGKIDISYKSEWSSNMPGLYKWRGVDMGTGTKSYYLAYCVNPDLQVQPSEIPAGDELQINGSGFTPNSTVGLHFWKEVPNDVVEFDLKNVKTNSEGKFSFKYSTPKDNPAADYWARITAIDALSDADANLCYPGIVDFTIKSSQTGQQGGITPAKLVSPENNAVITTLEYKFSWQHDYDDDYALIITDMKDKELYNQRTKEKSETVNFGDDLLAIKGETYKWYVVVYKANGQQASSDKRTFAFKDSSASGTCLEIINFTAYDKDQYMILPTAGKPAIATLTIRNVGDTVSAAKNAKLWIAPLDVPGKDCDSSYTEQTQQEHIIKDYVFDVSLNNLAPGEKQVITQELVFYNACYTDKLMVILRSDKDKPLCQKSEYLEETTDFALYPNENMIWNCYLTLISLVALPALEAAGISEGTIAAAEFVVNGVSTARDCFDAGYKIPSDESSGSVIYALFSCVWDGVMETLSKKVSLVLGWFKFALEELYSEGGCTTEFFPPMWQLTKDVAAAAASKVSEAGHDLWTFIVGSPVDIEVLDAQGNAVYVSKAGELKNTIPNAVTSVINNGTEHPIKTIAIIDGDSYTVNVYGKAQGTANIHIIHPKADGTMASVDFQNVNVTPDMKAQMTVSTDTSKYVLNIDRNNDGAFEEQVTTDSIKAIAAAPVAPHVANAGADITVSERNTVTLNGSSSTGAVSYQWTMLGKAPDWIETPKLSDPNSPNSTFTAPEVGVDGGSMVFQLTVTDSTGRQSSDVCNVKILNIN